MTKREMQSAVSKIAKMEKALAKTRDELDEHIMYFQQLYESCDEAIDDLQRARDALSRFV